MRLKFIGIDGSMGLMNGQVYEVKITRCPDGMINACWYDLCGKKYCCPYASFKKFLENWDTPDDVFSPSEDTLYYFINMHKNHSKVTSDCIDIQDIINDAMKNKDRYVSILVTNEGHMSINVYPHEEEEAHWIPNGLYGDDITYIMNYTCYTCSACGATQDHPSRYCPECGEELKINE